MSALETLELDTEDEATLLVLLLDTPELADDATLDAEETATEELELLTCNALDTLLLALLLASTAIENNGKEVVALPSLTEILMFEYVPAAAAPGVPVKAPVVVLKVAQDGFREILNPRTSPLASLAVGTNEYKLPTDTVVAGLPLITGAVLDLVRVVAAPAVTTNPSSIGNKLQPLEFPKRAIRSLQLLAYRL